MLDFLVKAAVGYAVGTFATKALTGRHIHEHVLDIWETLRDTISQWLGQNRHLGIVRVVGCLVCKLDDIAIATRKTTKFFVNAVDAQQQKHSIQVLDVSADELACKFPNLKLDNTVTLEMAT